MSNPTIIAIDLAKDVLQVCKVTSKNKISYNKTVSRKALKELLSREKDCLVAMEACASSQYWSRFALKLGLSVKAMHARHVKPFRTKQKTDRNDALAIAVAATQLTIKPTRILTIDEQGLQSLERIRDLQKSQCIAISNQIRSLLGEFGITIAKGDKALREAMPYIFEDAENELPHSLRAVLFSQWENYRHQVEHLDSITEQLEVEVQKNHQCQKFMKLEGVGPLGAIGLVIALGDGKAFTNGRAASACIGVTPVQHSSGGKENIGSIAKKSSGQRLRSVLFNGAMSVVSFLSKRAARTVKEQWLKALIERRGKKVAAVALINKNIRTAYAILINGTQYKPQLLEA
ncbi:IS110 family transposase [Aliivibrio fischeri]|uniref:IS110 family transposase n=1 Tax=Aliivibrio fischeri TaxID=668 RepID=UPI00080D96B1|nr:IS110 family transposase [Aliivibrio fischeri]OCH33377.1 transposase [Aliivibrio fischeri]